ncbi:MAG: hypothetical protein ABR530_07050 [Pyrinomonadaceae bacterium]
MTAEDHNKYLAWTFLVHGSIQLLLMMLMFVFFSVAFPVDPRDGPLPVVMMMFGIISLFQMLFAVPSFVAAFALIKRKSWARIAAIVAGVVSSMNVPFGTAACAYSLWFFLGDAWKDVYPVLTEPGDDLAHQLSRGRDEGDARWSGLGTNERGEVVFHPVEPPDWR